ncbi:MAG: hypothetical protein ACJAWC_002755 [Yoonia sp.]
MGRASLLPLTNNIAPESVDSGTGENMSIDQIEDVELLYGVPKSREQKALKLNPIYGLLPPRAVRNPITRSGTCQKVVLPYKVAATGFQTEIGLCDSLAEVAVGEEALISPDVYDVEFQAVTFPYRHPKGSIPDHTIDLRITYHNGLRRMVFVRYGETLRRVVGRRGHGASAIKKGMSNG